MIYRFDPFTLDTDSLELRKGNDVISLEPQVFKILAYLIEHRDRVVGKEELIENIWDGRAISDGALNSRINSARRAVGDSGSAQAIIKTFTRRGFRFVVALPEDSSIGNNPIATGSIAHKPSIAVLPFVNVSGDAEQEYFSDGVTEDLITALSRIRWFRVVARNSTFAYKGQSPDIRKVAAELSVRYVIEGSVRRAGDRIRLSAQLIDGAKGEHLWAERYDRELSDIFELQDELTQTIVSAIEPELDRAERERALRTGGNNLAAWEFHQRAMWHYHRRTKSDYLDANQLFRRAIAEDSNLAPAYMGLAQNLCMLAILGYADSPRANFEEAVALAQKAIEIDPQDARAHLSLSRAYLLSRQPEKARHEALTAIELDPNSGVSHYQLGAALVELEDLEAALEKVETAIRLSPNDPMIAHFYARMAQTFLYLERYEDTVTWAGRALRQPGVIWPMAMWLASALGHLGRKEEAESAIKEIVRLNPDFSETLIRDVFALTNTERMNFIIDGLRKAGWED